MNVLLWVLQVVLALVFAAAGSMKLAKPRAQVAEALGGWVDEFPAPLLKPLGLVEILAAFGLVLPPAVATIPDLTPVAASGLVAVMVGAVVTHARRSEYPNVAVNLALAAMAVTVAWGRFGPHAF
jgi:uncharacterized membrane protein YphA (DoxX/SURF4 family)